VHTVLVVSDDLAVCNAVRYSFGIDPQFVVCAESENDIDALAKANESFPELVVVDLSMPSSNGFEIAKKLTLLNPGVTIFALAPAGKNITESEAVAWGITAVFYRKDDMSVVVQKAREALKF
jgi:two-component system, chemotaxis family, chemotaxis protein CheY